MIASLAFLLLPLAGLQDPVVALDSPVLPGAGSSAVQGGATITFRGEEIRSDWIEPGAWAIRDSKGKVHSLGRRPRKSQPMPLPGGAVLTQRLDLSPALELCALGPAELLFFPEPKGAGKVMKPLTIARKVTSREMNFGDRNAFTDAQLAKVRVQIETSVGGEDTGTMTAEFWPEAAPVTVRNFVQYAAEGHYDGLTFHRVIPGFMIQGGDPTGTGTGQGGRGTIPGEFSQDKRFSHQRGVISMARSSDPNSASCQFFICHGDATALDGKYAAFGRLIDGDDALEAIATAPTRSGGEGSKPSVPCVIKKMSVLILE